MTGITITTTEDVSYFDIDPIVGITLKDGVLMVDNGLHTYQWDYSLITKIEFYELEGDSKK